MRFDWKEESKERYFRIAEQKIKAAGFETLLRVDRTKFGVVGDRLVKVWVEKVHRSGNMREWWAVKREMPEFYEQQPPRGAFGKREKTIFLNGYIEIEMEEVSESESEIRNEK